MEDYAPFCGAEGSDPSEIPCYKSHIQIGLWPEGFSAIELRLLHPGLNEIFKQGKKKNQEKIIYLWIGKGKSLGWERVINLRF